MPLHSRPRRLATAALTVALLALAAGCAQDYNSSVFSNHTDFNRAIDSLLNLTIWLGGGVFVFVEVLLVYVMIKYRAKPGQPDPEHVHGNTTLEITWTVIPAVILLFIAVPTVKTIFQTEGRAKPDALHIEVIGHQWWWEFRYPEYGIVTANELYLPVGRTAEFKLTSADVLHSFWIPALGGKRDLITNRTNYIWFTPDSTGVNAWNGVCAEYCGTSHANMRFRTFTVSQADFDSWVKNQQGNAAVLPSMPGAPAPAGAAPGATTTTASAKPPKGAAPAAGAPAVDAAVIPVSYMQFPLDKIPEYARPNTPTPPGLTFDESLKGDPMNGAKLMMGAGGCFACHFIKGNPMMLGQNAPNLTHIASRTTIAGALYPNDTKHLHLWVKNAPLMKPGATMPTWGKGQYNPTAKMTLPPGTGLTDQQIADIVAYLQLLK